MTSKNRLGAPEAFFWIIGILIVFVAVALFENGDSIASILGTILTLALVLAFVVYSRFRSSADRAMGARLESITRSRSASSPARARWYLLIAGCLLIAGLFSLVTSTRSGHLVVGLAATFVIAPLLGYQALREYRQLREADSTSIQIQSGPRAKPISLLVVYGIIAIIMIIGNFRRIVAPVSKSSIFVGVAQLLVFVPVLGYLAFREYRRMKG